MKMYEGAEAGRRFMPLVPVVARIDGRCFSKFTKGMQRPFDPRMTEAMLKTTQALMNETAACAGYTQSDEITLIWHQTDLRSQIWFDGRISKMVSQLAAQATVWFNWYCADKLTDFCDRMPTFDARVWTVPNQIEGVNVFIWREWDATKNSIAMAAHEHFSPKQLHGKNGKQMLAMLEEKGVQWADYPVSFKRGSYFLRRIKEIKFSSEELEKLPPRHAARSNPDLTVERSVVELVQMPVITTIVNQESVIFRGEEPIVA